MYIRFDTPRRDRWSRMGRGIFQAAFDSLDNTPVDERGWQQAELRRELDWFNDRLSAPDRMLYRNGRRAERSGICWFRSSAEDHIRHARYMAWLLEDLGIPVRNLRSPDPGTILWQDEHQIVALPCSGDVSLGRYVH